MTLVRTDVLAANDNSSRSDATSFDRLAITNEPLRRCIFLGASNLTRALAPAIATARTLAGGPIRCFVAAGHGRSYGIYSRLLGRGLRGILHCNIWQALASDVPPLPTYVLITDVGNDIAYGREPAEINVWIRQCIDRLLPLEPVLVLTGLPLASLDNLTARRYLIMRTLLFPSNRLGLDETLRRAEELNAMLQETASQYGIPLVPQPAEWFGMDPVHILRAELESAYRSILAHWQPSPVAELERLPMSVRLRLQVTAPASQEFGFWTMHRSQPALTLRDNTSLAFF